MTGTFYVAVACEALQGRVAQFDDLESAQRQAGQLIGRSLRAGDTIIGEVRDAWVEDVSGWRHPAAQRQKPSQPSSADQLVARVMREIAAQCDALPATAPLPQRLRARAETLDPRAEPPAKG